MPKIIESHEVSLVSPNCWRAMAFITDNKSKTVAQVKDAIQEQGMADILNTRMFYVLRDGRKVTFSLLQLAVLQENLAIVKALLESGATPRSATCLVAAVEQGNLEIVDALLAAGAKPAGHLLCRTWGGSGFHDARDTDTTTKEYTLLEVAADLNRLDIAHSLLAHHAPARVHGQTVTGGFTSEGKFTRHTRSHLYPENECGKMLYAQELTESRQYLVASMREDLTNYLAQRGTEQDYHFAIQYNFFGRQHSFTFGQYSKTEKTNAAKTLLTLLDDDWPDLSWESLNAKLTPRESGALNQSRLGDIFNQYQGKLCSLRTVANRDSIMETPMLS